MPRRGHPCRCCAECDTACPRTSHRAIALENGDFDPPHLTWNPASTVDGYTTAAWAAPECAWKIIAGTPVYDLWQDIPRAPAALAELNLTDEALQPLTTPAAMAAIRAAIATQNWDATEQRDYFHRLFLNPTTNPPTYNRTMELDALTAPFHAIRDATGKPQATFELRCLAGPFDPWSTTLDFGCDPTTGQQAALSVRLTRQITPAGFTDHASAVRFYAPNGSLHCLSWLLELLDHEGQTLHQATLLHLPGHEGAPWPNPPPANLWEYVRVAFKRDADDQAHVAVYLASSYAHGFQPTNVRNNDDTELYNTWFNTLRSGVASIAHHFPPVPAGNDRGGRGIRTTEPVRVTMAPLGPGVETASSFPPSATQACDQPPSSADFQRPHVQASICDRRTANGHVPMALEGRSFSRLLVHLGPERTPGDSPAYMATLLGVHELDAITTSNAPLVDGTFYSATTPNTPFPETFLQPAGFLRSLEISATLRVKTSDPCTTRPPRSEWLAAVYLTIRAGYEFTGPDAPPPRPLHSTIGWYPTDADNGGGFGPAIYFAGPRVTRLLSGLPVSVGYFEGLYGDAAGWPYGGFSAHETRTYAGHHASQQYNFITFQLLE